MLSNTRLDGQIWMQTKKYLNREKGLYTMLFIYVCSTIMYHIWRTYQWKIKMPLPSRIVGFEVTARALFKALKPENAPYEALKNYTFIVRSEDTIFIFHVWRYLCRHGY